MLLFSALLTFRVGDFTHPCSGEAAECQVVADAAAPIWSSLPTSVRVVPSGAS